MSAGSQNLKITREQAVEALKRMNNGDWKVFDDEDLNARPISALLQDWIALYDISFLAQPAAQEWRPIAPETPEFGVKYWLAWTRCHKPWAAIGYRDAVGNWYTGNGNIVGSDFGIPTHYIPFLVPQPPKPSVEG